MDSREVLRAGPDRALAFRLGGHNLAARLPRGSLLRAVGACGVQNTPPGSAALALHARVAGLTPADVDRAFEKDKTLLQTFRLRGRSMPSRRPMRPCSPGACCPRARARSASSSSAPAPHSIK
ncbi:MAG TPA: crosslink repair DNA glycosylase YcaQ family protein [Methanocella sp.]|nr:crosslink repair DNA glycosylase YcaQ family protein [Methanocella sp.]